MLNRELIEGTSEIKSEVLGAKQIAWCKEKLRGFNDDDGKTRLEKRNERRRTLNEQRKALGLQPQ